jgi:predicted DNA binding CopG/RHH family protein
MILEDITMKKNTGIDPFDEEERILMKAVKNGHTREATAEENNEVIKAIRSGKTRTISLRLNEEDLELLKKKAASAGIPYQTLISSVLHRYLNGDIVLKENI